MKPWEKCKHHGPAAENEWACPSCLRELRAEIDSLRTQLAEARAEVEALTEALAQCRDVFPAREPQAHGEAEWLDAMAFPGAVPNFVRVMVEALRKDAERFRAIRSGISYTIKCKGVAFHCGGHTLQQGATGYGEALDAAIDSAIRAMGSDSPDPTIQR